uniref:Lysosomal Pro-X carboxypeptidase n=1 Tax=Arcella intermedia TaxID=1963864 RepID=A0A6B2L2S3_9EUKA
MNATGLMWENAPSLGALLVFAEHRYFGRSLPFPSGPLQHLRYLSAEQALADYAALLFHLSGALFPPDTPVVAVGGSYGGMLAAWLRLKYPGAVDGAIAASAPVLSFFGETPEYDPSGYYAVVTSDASPRCQEVMRSVWEMMESLSQTPQGLSTLSGAFQLCSPVESWGEVSSLLFPWISGASSFLAMGDYPYPSSYITNGGCLLPPWPMDAACAHLEAIPNGAKPEVVLQALREFAGTFYNCSKDLSCFDIKGSVNNQTLLDGLLWDYLWCAEITQPFAQNGRTDMFWPLPFNLSESEAACAQSWGVALRPEWATVEFGGRRALRQASNILFTNGQLDPWKAGGVRESLAPSVEAIVIEKAAHHLDLMFSNPLDPPSVLQARAAQLAHIKQWIEEKKQSEREGQGRALEGLGGPRLGRGLGQGRVEKSL